MGMRATLGPSAHEEYLTALAEAKTQIDAAICAMEPVTGRRAIRDAVTELGRADTRLAAHAAPPS